MALLPRGYGMDERKFWLWLKRYLIPAFFIVCLCSPLSTRGQGNVPWTIKPSYETANNSTALTIEDDDGNRVPFYSESNAILVVEGEYQHPEAWQKVADSGKQNEDLLRKVLESRGFHVMVWRDLTGTQLRTVLGEAFGNFGYRIGSRLFFYYYGHGHTINLNPDLNGSRTFLVPIDAPNPIADEQGFYRTALPITQLVEYANQITVKHAFFAFESCRAGSVIKSLAPILPYPKGYLFGELVKNPVKQFLTAGSAEQDVLASSPFTPMLVGAIESSDADSNHDGYVTGSEMMAYVSSRVPQATKYQDPEHGSIPPNGGGDMIMGLVTGSVVNLNRVAFKSSFEFSGLPVNLSLSEDLSRFDYGYTSVESDPTISGEDIRINKVRVDLKVRTHTEYGCCDVWVLLGPETVQGIHPAGQTSARYFFIDANSSQAPVQAQFVIGGKPLKKGGITTYSATYDFESGRPGGDVSVTKGKAYFAPLLDLQHGLYAQILLWSGGTAVNLDVLSVSLTVEGTKRKQ